MDDIDLKILKEFCKLKSDEKITTWRIMKKIYPKGRDVEHMRIKKKILRMSKHNLFFISENPKEYTLIKDNVKLNKIPKIKNCISIKINNFWEIFEI